MSTAMNSKPGMVATSESVTGEVAVEAQKQSVLAKVFRWSPTSRKDIIDSEKRLLTTLVK